MLQKKREKMRDETRLKENERVFQKNRSRLPDIHICEIGQYCYNTDALIGRGTYSEVFIGWRLDKRQQKVAVKVCSANERVQKEVEMQKTIKSKHVVQVFDQVFLNDKCYIIMELCDEPLSARYSTLNRQESIIYFKQILNGLEELHNKNIIHRDLKLDNILIKKKQIKITDFGFAKEINKLGSYSVKCGTPETMAPEVFKSSDQVKVKYTDKQDVWSIGVILHQLFYKTHPFQGSVDQNNERVSNSDVDTVVDSLIDGCLQWDEKHRLTLNEVLKHPIRKYKEPTPISNESDEEGATQKTQSILIQLKNCVTTKLDTLTQYWKDTLQNYFKKQ